MEKRRILGPALAVVLLGAIGTGIRYSHDSLPAAAPVPSAAPVARLTELRGLIGSEKAAFFADERVQQALAAHGLRVSVVKAGSRTIATEFDPHASPAWDFAFPSGAPAAAELRSRTGAARQYTPFYTPIVIASWQPIVDILAANGVAARAADGSYTLDLRALLALCADGRRWRDLAGSAAFATGKSVLVTTTDVRSSNSAAMWLALASYVLNGEQVVQDAAQLERVLPQVAPLFLRQGWQDATSADPFQDYVALGMGKTPLLLAYESQFIEFRLAHPQRASDAMVLLYPRPTLYSKHVLVPMTAAGARLGELLDTDAGLQALMHAYGFRTAGDEHGPGVWQRHGVAVPATLVDVVDPPGGEWLERMIQGIEARYR